MTTPLTDEELKDILRRADGVPDWNCIYRSEFSAFVIPSVVSALCTELLERRAKDARNADLLAGYKALLTMAYEQQKSSEEIAALMKEIGL
jgi:hypothetical protein